MFVQGNYRIDFIGIGAAKSGTTWLAHILKNHPQVFISPLRKEINYFNKYLAQDYQTVNYEYRHPYEWYHSFFKDVGNGQIAGDITPSYLSMENAALDIFNYNPAIKLFSILRNPIERSFSEYLFSKQNGVNNYKTFEEALEKNPKKFVQSSMYARNLERFYDKFQRNQIKILFFDDIQENAKELLNEVYEFLNIDPFYPDNYESIINKGKVARSHSINNIIGQSKLLIHRNGLQFFLPFLKKLGVLNLMNTIKNKNLTARKEKLSPDPTTKQKLMDKFVNDIERLEELTGRDLSSWKII